jgi:hypothetical protein
MKTRKTIWSLKSIFIGILLPLLLAQCATSQKAAKLTASDIKNMVDSSRFVFVAERATPLRGGSRYLTSRYEVVIKKDSIDCYLPFFGRAYQAPVDPSKGGIQFISTNFTSQVNPKNSDEWEVILKPADYTDVQQLYFNIFDNGTAVLNVSNRQRDPISFDGHIERIKK